VRTTPGEAGARFTDVTAVVVTFDGPDALVSCLRCIAAQTLRPRHVLVVDNASRPPAQSAIVGAGLDDGTVEVVRLPQNTGPAGGMATGLTAFAAGEDRFAWLLDDDAFAHEECLERLIGDAVRHPRSVMRPVVSAGGRVLPGWPGWNGALIPRGAVEAVGVPRADLFWWVEDTEYLLWRLPRAGFDGATCHGATVSQGYARRGPNKAAWKYYYEARNTLWYRLWVQRGRRLWMMPWTWARMIGGIVIGQDQPGLKLAMVARGTADGLLVRLGKRVAAE